jgi:MFS family permease
MSEVEPLSPTARRPPLALPTFASLALPQFRLLLAGTVLSQLAGWMEEVARGWLVWSLSHSALQLQLLAFIGGLSRLLAAPVAGYLTDRLERRFLAAFTQVGDAAVAAGIGLLVTSGTVQLWHLYLLHGALAWAHAVNMTARQALVYDVVGPRYLTNAVGLNSVASNVSRIAAPALGGAVVGVLGVEAAFYGQAALLLLSVPFTLLLRLAVSSQPVRLPFLAGLREGIAYLRCDPVLLRLMALNYLPHVLIYPYVTLLPEFAERVLGAGPRGFGLLLTGVGFGSIPGGLLVASMSGWRRKGLAMTLAAALYMGMVALFSQSALLPLSFACLVVAGVGWSLMVGLNQALVQLRLPEEMRGRGLGLYNLGPGLGPLGNLAMGGSAQWLGVQTAVASFALSGLGLALLLGLGSRQVRQL